jgi:predicted molibdopterin-dependent oxidoreductase YjgC
VVGQKVKQAVANGAKLLVIDPRETEMAGRASHWLPVRPGSDLMLLASLAHVLLADGIYDEDYVSANTTGRAELTQSLACYAPEMVEAATGVEAELVRAAAEDLGTSLPLAIVFSSGVAELPSGREVIHALANLALLTGAFGLPGGGIFVLGGQNNVHGACEMGALPDRLPGLRPLADDSVRRRFGEAWAVAVPEDSGLGALDMLRAARDGALKALLVFGENPARSLPGDAEQALRGLDLLVVSDLFLTETARLADVVLPAAALAEKEGTVTTADRTVRFAGRALAPPGEARPDLQTICDLAARLGASWSATDPSGMFDEMASLVPEYRGMSHARLRSGPLVWPCAEPDDSGRDRLFEEGFADAPVELRRAEPVAVPVSSDPAYPILLLTGRMLAGFGTGDMERHSPMLAAAARREVGRERAGDGAETTILLNPRDAAELGVPEGSTATVASESGSVQAVVCLSDSLAAGQAFMATSGALGQVNRLFGDVYDPQVVRTVPKAVAIRIEPHGIRRRQKVKR